jgi:hypothetical protein
MLRRAFRGRVDCSGKSGDCPVSLDCGSAGRIRSPTSLSRPLQGMSAALASQRSERITRSVDAFRRIVRALRLCAQQTHTEAGVTAAQLFVLTVLGEGCPCSLTELGARTHSDRTSVRGLVNRLSEQGLVRRGRSDVDRRQARTPAEMLFSDGPAAGAAG